ncbi:MFS transporter [Knoellia sinensis KCTC 19936]|uniref:MFS transporter n=1 Tax=Knoellia sinensis KCTC 19936 TaxID=1385520 RepID=A0A0A0J4H8_9MICO|nr:MFS transporter [Knoellia sinensis]KGN31644.1 MFS transporter [Knoellia sinensis KCTC 19936]
MTTTTATEATAPEALIQSAPTRISGRTRTLALVSLLLASMMELIDITIVNVALPTIERSLGASASMLQWVVAAYPLTFGIALIAGARLGDRFGRKRLFIAGLVGFTVASAACGYAPSVEFLVAFRALQGVAAAAMVPQVLTSIQVMYAPHERGTAMGIFSGLAGLASVMGPILGAVLTDLSGWRAVFLVNIPVGIIALVAALKFIPESRSEHPVTIKSRSVFALAAGLLAILYPLTMGHELGWPTWSFALMAVGLVGLVAFLRSQRNDENRGGDPLVTTSLYAGRSGRGFRGATIVGSVLFVLCAGYFLSTTLYLQMGLGWSVLKAGLVNIPFAITATIGAGSGAAVLMPKIGRQVLLMGAVIMAAGVGFLALVVGDATTTTSFWAFVPAFAVVGLGFGFMVSSIMPLGLGKVEGRHAGSASGLMNTTTQLANAVGAAALGTLFFEVAAAQKAQLPLELLRPAYIVVLLVSIALLSVVALATRLIPADAHRFADHG